MDISLLPFTLNWRSEDPVCVSKLMCEFVGIVVLPIASSFWAVFWGVMVDEWFSFAKQIQEPSCGSVVVLIQRSKTGVWGRKHQYLRSQCSQMK